MPDHAAHLQAILEAATAAAKANPTTAKIAAAERARKAVDEYARVLAGDSAGERFKTQAQALEYLQRRYQIEKSKLSKDHQIGRIPRKDGFFTARDLDYYAEAECLELRNSEITSANPSDERLKKAMAEERELRVEKLKGKLLNAADEEARRAAVILGIRRHLEVCVPDRVKTIISSISSVLNDEQRAILAARTPEFIEQDMDALADYFDHLAQAGGIEVL